MPTINTRRLSEILVSIESELYGLWIETKNRKQEDILLKLRNRILLLLQTIDYYQGLKNNNEIEYSGDEYSQ